jgi:hypothetical protein
MYFMEGLNLVLGKLKRKSVYIALDLNFSFYYLLRYSGFGVHKLFLVFPMFLIDVNCSCALNRISKADQGGCSQIRYVSMICPRFDMSSMIIYAITSFITLVYSCLYCYPVLISYFQIPTNAEYTGMDTREESSTQKKRKKYAFLEVNPGSPALLR